MTNVLRSEYLSPEATKVHCEFWHETDGKCCTSHQSCYLKTGIAPMPAYRGAKPGINWTKTWLYAICFCALFWTLAIMAIVMHERESAPVAFAIEGELL
jgi:hypothetical protein